MTTEEKRIKDLEYQVSFLEKKVAVYESEDLEKEGYFVLKSWIKKQIDVVKDFDLKDEITKNPKEDKTYDRVKALGEDLKKMISDLSTLKQELKISQKDEQDFKRNRITPETIADNIGNTAGKNM